MDKNEALVLASMLWQYHHMGHQLEKSDCILALGSHDTRVAERAADLYLAGWAPTLIFSGGLGNFTKNRWTQPEADVFANLALERGVPRQAILIENQSTNTGENIAFTRRLLFQNNMEPASFLLVQKPYMERRSYATFKKCWPDKKVLVTSPQVNFEDYPTAEITMENVIHIMVGDFQRIMRYPAMGFQIEQDIPGQYIKAYERLVELGFSKHLIGANGL